VKFGESMRKFRGAMGLVLLVGAFAACTNEDPENVVAKYYAHFYKGEYDKLQHYVVEEQRPFYALMNDLITAKEKEKNAQEKVVISDVKCKIFSDTIAECSCQLKIGNREPQNEAIQLKKVDKIWLVE
jgi:hypothetical protein